MSAEARLIAQLPDPGRFWIGYRFRAWPGIESPWTDLARGTLGAGDEEAEPGPGQAVDDLVYLPPVPPGLLKERERTARRHLERGTPVLLQVGRGPAGEMPEGATLVHDLLPWLLADDLEALADLPEGRDAVWPLIPGLSDDPERWERGCAQLAKAGARTVQALAVSLSPQQRRRLVDEVSAARWEETFHALFHRQPPPERDFARVAADHGLAPFLDRPLPRPPLRRAGNRRLAGALNLAAELWLRLGRPVGRGMALSKAARWIDTTAYDVEMLIRDGNLGVVEELEPGVVELLTEWPATGRLDLLTELLAEYAPGPGEEPGRKI